MLLGSPSSFSALLQHPAHFCNNRNNNLSQFMQMLCLFGEGQSERPAPFRGENEPERSASPQDGENTEEMLFGGR